MRNWRVPAAAVLLAACGSVRSTELSGFGAGPLVLLGEVATGGLSRGARGKW